MEDNYLVNFKPLFFRVKDSIKSLELEPFVFHINDGILEGVIKQDKGIYSHIKMSNFDASIITKYFKEHFSYNIYPNWYWNNWNYYTYPRHIRRRLRRMRLKRLRRRGLLNPWNNIVWW